MNIIALAFIFQILFQCSSLPLNLSVDYLLMVEFKMMISTEFVCYKDSWNV